MKLIQSQRVSKHLEHQGCPRGAPEVPQNDPSTQNPVDLAVYIGFVAGSAQSGTQESINSSPHDCVPSPIAKRVVFQPTTIPRLPPLLQMGRCQYVIGCNISQCVWDETTDRAPHGGWTRSPKNPYLQKRSCGLGVLARSARCRVYFSLK